PPRTCLTCSSRSIAPTRRGRETAAPLSDSRSWPPSPSCTAARPVRRVRQAEPPASKSISPRHPPTEEDRMLVAPPKTEVAPPVVKESQHPKGTLFLIGLYGVVFAAAWFAVYFFVYLRRGGVTP